MATREQKIRFLKRVYFGTTNNPNDDVNPYENLEDFGNATVGSLRWGIDSNVKRHSKIRFADNYSRILRHYKILLSIADIYTALEDDKINNDVVTDLADLADFR